MGIEVPIEGGQRLHDAVASGRPVILAGTHIGWGNGFIAYNLGYRNLACVSLPWLVPPDGRLPRGLAGYGARNLRDRSRIAGTLFLPSGGSYNVLRGLLQQRRICILMIDIPGEHLTRMAGKNAYLRTGTARLAYETGALVVPIVGLLDRSGPTLAVHEPIDAAAAEGWEEILDDLAQIHGELVLSHPASVEPLPWMRDIWRDEGTGYAIQNWMPVKLRQVGKHFAARATGAVRVRVRRLMRS
jgi:hypothetical protein